MRAVTLSLRQVSPEPGPFLLGWTQITEAFYNVATEQQDEGVHGRRGAVYPRRHLCQPVKARPPGRHWLGPRMARGVP